MNIFVIIMIQAATVGTRAPTARGLRHTDYQNYEQVELALFRSRDILVMIMMQAATVVTRAPTAFGLRHTDHQNYEHLSHNHDTGCHSGHQGSHSLGPEAHRSSEL